MKTGTKILTTGTLAKYAIAIILLLHATGAVASTVSVRGIVRDSVSFEGIPYASIIISGTESGAVADADGVFELVVPEEARSLKVASQGYTPAEIALWTNSLNIYDVRLRPEATQLREIVVGKARYSKRNNPAVDFVNRLRRSADIGDPRANPWYSYNRYERIAMGINDFDTVRSSGLLRKYPFLIQHVDTSAISGKSVLNLSVNEKASSVYFRNSPGARKEMVTGIRQRGVDEIVDNDNMQTILSDALREIDLYNSDIMLLRNSFVSPLSPIGPDYYKYYLVDSAVVDNEKCVVLAFYPRSAIGNAFSGHIYTAAGDTAMTIRRVELKSPRNSNLNFVRSLNIEQTYDRAADGSRLKTSDCLAMELSVLPGAPEIYVTRNIAYSGHSFEAPADSAIFDTVGEVVVSDSAAVRDSLFWSSVMPMPEPEAESRVSTLMDRLREIPLYYWGELILKRLVTGYWPTAKKSKFDFGPLNTLASYNALEGVRVRVGGMTTANLSPRWFARGYVAYGFADHKLKYSAEIEHSFRERRYHPQEFPIHSLKLRHTYDVDRIGSHYLFTNADNFVLSLTRMPARLDTYRRSTSMDYTLEFANNFSLKASLEYLRQESSRFVNLHNTEGTLAGHYSQAVVAVELRYAPGERFYQMRTGRVPVNRDAPVFVLSHKFSPKGFLGSRYALNKTEFNFSKRFWLSVAGQLDVMAGAGHVWTASPFPELLMPNANVTYTIQPQSFALMTPLEFINTSYVSWELCYHMDGLIFNHIPWVRRLGLREIVGFRGLYGKRSAAATPGESNPALPLFPVGAPARIMDRGPYMEISAGLDNVFRILRVEYVWRLSYRHEPYRLDRSGLQVALHFTF